MHSREEEDSGMDLDLLAFETINSGDEDFQIPKKFFRRKPEKGKATTNLMIKNRFNPITPY